MIIRGNTVGALMPRTDYNQTDPTKANYLVGKDALDQKIDDAKKAADDAAVAAGKAKTEALLKSGGTMAGDINMDGHHVLNLPTPTEDSDIITKAYMESYITSTFLGGEW